MKRRSYKTDRGYKVRKLGREKRIYYTAAGEPFFVWNGRREHFENVLRIDPPVMYEDENGKKGAIGGGICVCNFGGPLVELCEGCEAVQLWEEIMG